jgi:hypothetical protein
VTSGWRQQIPLASTLPMVLLCSSRPACMPPAQGYDRVASLLDVSISPDAFEPWAHSMQQLVTWALVPASDEHLA